MTMHHFTDSEKDTAIHNFYVEYLKIASEDFLLLKASDVRQYLENDIFIGVASATTGIAKDEFVEWAVRNSIASF